MFIKLQIYLEYYEFDKIAYILLTTTHQANFDFRKLTQDIPQGKMYIILGT